jgi:hypothetical protein
MNLSPADAAAAFLASFHPRYDVPEVMRGFRRPSTSAHVPGFFRYLVLSAYVPAVAADDDATRNFRLGLGRALGLMGPVDNLSELPAMWKRLVRWCDARRAEGKPYRRLVLPDPGAWTIVGYSVRLAFPSWRDRERLTRRVEAIGSSRLGAPRVVISLLKHEVESDAYSQAMRDAFEDFRTRFQRGERLLLQHRFWRLLEEARTAGSASRGPAGQGQSASLTLLAGLDDADFELEFVVRVGASDPDTAPAGTRLSGPVDVVLRQLGSSAAALGSAARDIAKSVSAGLLLFVERQWGTWQFCRGADVRAHAVAVVREDVHRSLKQSAPACRPVGGGWLVSRPLPLGTVEDLVARVLRSPLTEAGDELAAVALVGAIRTGSALLGRPAVLPSVRATSLATVSAEPAGGARGRLCAELPAESRREPGTWRLASDEPVGGAWRILAREGDSDDGVEAEILLRFDERAVEHPDLADPDRSPELLEHERELLFSTPGALLARPAPQVGERRGDARLLDLLEAIYAGGRSGWAESDLIPLILRALPTQGAPRVFDVLHVLHGSGWIEPRLLARWRGRRWFLRSPSIVEVCAEGESLAVLDGATPEVVRERFCATARNAGGEARERAPCGGWGVPMMVARVDDPSALASALDMELAKATVVRIEAAPGCWLAETRSLTNRERAASWCWHSGAFRPYAEPGPRQVRLERFVRARGDDRDIFSVTRPGGAAAVFESRAAAIIEAHRLAGQSLFQVDGGQLVRRAMDGSLPSPAVSYLRLLHLANPGIVLGGEHPPRLAYPTDGASAKLARRWFGDAIGGVARRVPDSTLTVAVARRRLSRLTWNRGLRDGRLGYVESH